jgi:hypothetical protein
MDDDAGLPELSGPLLRYVAVGTGFGVSVVAFDELLAPVTIPLTTPSFNTTPPAWSPSGEQLAYAELTDAGYWRLEVARARDFRASSIVADIRPRAGGGHWLFWLGEGHVLMASTQAPLPPDTRPPSDIVPLLGGPLDLVELATGKTVDLGTYDTLHVAPDGAGAVASNAESAIVIGADGSTETFALDGGGVALSDDARHLLVYGTDGLPAVTGRTIAVDNVELEPEGDSNASLTSATYARGKWSLDVTLESTARTLRILYLVPSGVPTVLVPTAGVELVGFDRWGITRGGDRFVVQSRCDPECVWTARLADTNQALVGEAPGRVEHVRLSGDEKLLYVSTLDLEAGRTTLYAAPFEPTAPGPSIPIPFANGEAALVPLGTYPGGPELLFAEDPEGSCSFGTSCSATRFAFTFDGHTGGSADLPPSIQGPAWMPDGLGFVDSRDGRLVYVRTLRTDLAYELGAADARQIYVPPAWPPSERPR